MKDRANAISISGIRAFSQQFADVDDLVFLTIGEPDLDTPQVIKDAAVAALNDNHTHYPPALGDMLLRKKIAEYESSLHNEAISLDQVIVVNGATEGLTLAFWAILNEGDNLIIPTPSFPLYQSQVKLSGAKTRLLDISKSDFQIDEAELLALADESTKGIILASPNNPTGTLFNKASIQSIVTLLHKYPDIYVVIDEVYRSMIYDGSYESIRDFKEFTDRIIVVNSFSKSHAMTGWRVGYVVAPVELMDAMHKLHQNLVTGVASFIQKACLVALDTDASYMNDVYRVRRDLVLASLDALDMDYPYPNGAFYVFVNVSKFGMGSIEFSVKMAETVGLVVIPGYYFGADDYVRISYGDDLEKVREAMRRFTQYIQSF